MAIAQKISNMIDQLFIFFNKAYKPKHGIAILVLILVMSKKAMLRNIKSGT